MRIANVGTGLVLMLLLAPVLAGGQLVPQRPIGVPDVKFDVELTRITAVREYSDGRAVLLDSKDHVVYLLDPRTKSAARIGREGAGPAEYARPSGLVVLPGDTILVADGGNNRFLVLGGGGKVLGTMPLVKIRPNPNTTYGVDISATDAQGRMYFLLPRGLVENPDDGTPVLRFDRRGERFDTVGRVFTPSVTAAPTQAAGNGGSFGMLVQPPFAARDEWVAAPDGSIAFVRADPYHVEWASARGTIVRGSPVPFEAVRVGAAEKDAWRKEMKDRSGTMTTTTADGKTTQQTVPVPEPRAWPATKAAFIGPAMIASNGSVWVERSRAASDTTVSYDVFGPTGRQTERVTMSGSRRVVGFGRGVVYVSVTDDDDLLHLERYKLAP